MARLDRLAQAKEVAQIGAVIGREFSHELLAAVTLLGEAELQDALGQLVAAELVFVQGAPPRRSTSSSTPWCRTQPMPACSRAGASSCTRASPGSWRGAGRR